MEKQEIKERKIFKPNNRITFFFLLIFIPVLVFAVTLYYDLIIVAIISLGISVLSLFIWLKFILYFISIDKTGISKKNAFFHTQTKILWNNLQKVQDIIEDFKLGDSTDKVRKLVFVSHDASIEISAKSIKGFEELYNTIEKITQIEVVDRSK